MSEQEHSPAEREALFERAKGIYGDMAERAIRILNLVQETDVISRILDETERDLKQAGEDKASQYKAKIDPLERIKDMLNIEEKGVGSPFTGFEHDKK